MINGIAELQRFMDAGSTFKSSLASVIASVGGLETGHEQMTLTFKDEAKRCVGEFDRLLEEMEGLALRSVNEAHQRLTRGRGRA